MKLNLSLILTFCTWIACISIGDAQKSYVYGGIGYSVVNNYNDDKGSQYFPEDAYIGTLGYTRPSLGIGYQIEKQKLVHIIDFGYKVIGGKGSYKYFVRPYFFVLPPSVKGEPSYEEQGLYSPVLSLSYHLAKKMPYSSMISLGVGVNYALQARLYYYLKADHESEWVKTGAGKLYFRKFTISARVGIEKKIFSLVGLRGSYEYFLSSINTIVDEVTIRTFHPHYLSLGVVIYNK